MLEFEKPLYMYDELKQDKPYVMKNLRFTEEEFDQMMKEKPVPHSVYEVKGSLFHYYPFLKPLQPLWTMYKNIRAKKL